MRLKFLVGLFAAPPAPSQNNSNVLNNGKQDNKQHDYVKLQQQLQDMKDQVMKLLI